MPVLMGPGALRAGHAVQQYALTPVLRRMFVGCRESAEALLRSELDSLSTIIMRAPHNESAWNYLRGLCCNLTLGALLEPSPTALCLEVSFRYSHRVVDSATGLCPSLRNGRHVSHWNLRPDITV